MIKDIYNAILYVVGRLCFWPDIKQPVNSGRPTGITGRLLTGRNIKNIVANDLYKNSSCK